MKILVTGGAGFIASHTNVELLNAGYEVVDLLLQFDGVVVTVAHGDKRGFVLCLVATKHQQVGDAEELQVEQHVLRLFAGEAAAKDVRHHGDVVLVLDGSSYGYGAGAAAQAVSLEQSVAEVFVHVLAAVRGDVDVFGVEFP